MALGAGLGGLITVVLPLIGVVAILRERRKTRRGGPGPEVTDRRAATAETERRMAAYLANSDTGHDTGSDKWHGHRASQNTSGQENRQ